MGVSLADVVLIVFSLLVLGLSAQAFARVLRDETAEAGGRGSGLTDGAVVLAADGRITALADGARALLGDCAGQPLTAALTRYLGKAGSDVLEAVQRLQNTGEPMRLVTRDSGGQPIELWGRPMGGHVRLVIRDAAPADAGDGDASETAVPARADGPDAPAPRHEEVEALTALLAEAPLIAWNRDRGGLIRWSGGQLMSDGRRVDVDDVLALLPPPGPVSPGEPDRSRFDVDNGGPVPLSVHTVEVAAQDGGRLGFAVDASMAASAERTLTRFVQTMTETFAHLTVGLAIFDRNGTLALFNPALVSMWQLDASWLARRPSMREIVDALRSTRRIPDVEDFHEWRGRLLKLFDDAERADYEEVWHLGDGSNIRVLARPHPHGGIAFVFDDVTERLRLEQRFRHSIDLRRATLDRMDEGLAVFRPDGILQFVNASFHRMWNTDAEALGPAPHIRDVAEMCGTASVEADVWARVSDFVIADPTRRPWRTRLTLGSGRVLSARVAALPDGSSMVLFTDITDSERIASALSERNEALEAASEMRSAVLDRISHRLRTPLNTIFGYAQLLTDPRFGELSERHREYAGGVLEAAGHLLDTIDDVTELAGLEIDPLHDEGAPHLVWETLELTAGLLHKRALSLRAELVVGSPGDTVAHLTCDLPELRQIAFTLAAEALQRGGEGRRIELSAAAADDGTTLELRTTETGGTGFGSGAAHNLRARSFLARMAERAGGSYTVLSGPSGEVTGAVCSLPGVLTPPADDELAVHEDEAELIDGLVSDDN